MIVSTGTGSTSWTYNVNKLTHQSVESILRIIFETTGKQINFKGKLKVDKVYGSPQMKSKSVSHPYRTIQ